MPDLTTLTQLTEGTVSVEGDRRTVSMRRPYDVTPAEPAGRRRGYHFLNRMGELIADRDPAAISWADAQRDVAPPWHALISP